MTASTDHDSRMLTALVRLHDALRPSIAFPGQVVPTR